MTDPVIEKILFSQSFTPSDIEYICPIDTSEEYKTFIRFLTIQNFHHIDLLLPEDLNLHIQQIEYLIKTFNKNKKSFFTFNVICSTLYMANSPILLFLLEETSIAYVLIDEWSRYGGASGHWMLNNIEHYFRKHLCQFLLESPTDIECQNIAEAFVRFASIDTFRIIYEIKELDLGKCLYWAAVNENLPIVQLLLRDPRLKLDQSTVELMSELILDDHYESFKLIYETCESILTEENLSVLLKEVLQADYHDEDRLAAFELIKRNVNYSEAHVKLFDYYLTGVTFEEYEKLRS